MEECYKKVTFPLHFLRTLSSINFSIHLDLASVHLQYLFHCKFDPDSSYILLYQLCYNTDSRSPGWSWLSPEQTRHKPITSERLPYVRDVIKNVVYSVFKISLWLNYVHMLDRYLMLLWCHLKLFLFFLYQHISQLFICLTPINHSQYKQMTWKPIVNTTYSHCFLWSFQNLKFVFLFFWSDKK